MIGEHGHDQSEVSRGAAMPRRVNGEGCGSGERGMLPLGMQTFREVRGSGAYYVDKTEFAYRMITEGKSYFLSRPRRFGKSLFVDTLTELFEGTEELFEGLFVHGRWDWSVRRAVVRIDFSGGIFNEPGGLHGELLAQLEDIEAFFGLAGGAGAPLPARFRRLLVGLHRRSGRRVVVLVDEYDKPILDALSVPDTARANRDFLRGFYGVLKAADRHVRFVFLTGVSKFSKVSLFSGLNNLKDITVSPVYSAVCGFTEADLDRVFAPELEGLDRALVRQWYNGYSWLGSEKVYNPYDVLTLLDEREFRAHWFETASPKFLVDTLIDRGVPTLTLTGMFSRDSLLSSFDVDHIGVEALMFQSGYLTIVGTEQRGNTTLYRLDYPNLEVRESLHEALLKQLISAKAYKSYLEDNMLPDILQQGDTQGLRDLFHGVFADIPYQWHSSSGGAAEYEAYYASVFYTYFSASGLDARVEDFTNRGRVDMAVYTPQYIWLFEFKTTEHTAEGAALQQMQDRGYSEKYLIHRRPVILAGIEFDPETRTIAHYQTTTIQPNPRTR